MQRELTGLDSDGDDFDAERFFERVHPEDLAELRAKIQRAVADGEEFNHEFRLQMADGQYRWLAGRGEVEFDERGKPCRMRGVNYDVTESHAAVEHLAENEAFLRSLLHSSADGIKVLDMEGRILSVNESAVRALEIEDADTLRGAVWRSFWPESMHAALDAALETARAGGVGRFHGHRFTAKGAHKIWDVVCTRIPGVGSYPPRLLCISRDITEIERIAQARQESEDRFRAIADNIAQFAWMTDETGAIVWYNKCWFEYTGTTMDEVNGWGWKQLHHPHHVDRVVEKFTRCLEAGDDWEDTFPLRGKHGNYRWFLSRAKAIRNADGQVTRWFGTNTDITEQLAADRSLARAHAQLKSIVGAAADAIVTLDEEGQILSVNSAVEHVFGCPPPEVIGRPISEFIVWSEHPSSQAEQSAGRIVVGKGREAVGRKKDGGSLPLEVSVSVTRLGNRRLYAAIIRDISERKRIEEVLRIRLRAIEFATNGILITDAQADDNPVIYANPAFEELTGYGAAEALGRNCRFLQGPDTSPASLAVIREAVRRHEECHVTILNYRKDGSRFWNDLHISPVEDDHGNVTHFVGVQTDVTGRIRYEQRLKEAQAQADSANRAKSEFLANMSHEIRTPLAAILGCADSLYRQVEEPDSKDVVRMIRDQGRLLLGILNDVLDLSKIEAGKLEISVERCEAIKILNDVYSLMHPQAVEKGIDLKTTYSSKLPTEIETDPLRLRQILLNLVSNAIKFTDQGQVEIQVSCQDEGGRRWMRLGVKDTGIGISNEPLKTIFEAFVQDRAQGAGRRSGTGLGLTICQRLVEMLGGTISVTSQLGRGSLFVVDVPVGDVGFAEMANSDELTRTAAIRDSQQSMDVFIPCRVLIAEDTRAVQFMLTRMLTNVVAGLTVSENGELAVAAVAEAEKSGQPIDVVLMDMHMPVMNGYDATRKLRKKGFSKPIIALTAGAMEGDRERCLQVGCTDYLPKPIDRVELLAKLEQHCGD